MTLPRSDNHTAAATDDYREGWDRIFAGKKHVDCARHKSAEPDMRERCSCEPSSGTGTAATDCDGNASTPGRNEP